MIVYFYRDIQFPHFKLNTSWKFCHLKIETFKFGRWLGRSNSEFVLLAHELFHANAQIDNQWKYFFAQIQISYCRNGSLKQSVVDISSSSKFIRANSGTRFVLFSFLFDFCFVRITHFAFKVSAISIFTFRFCLFFMFCSLLICNLIYNLKSKSVSKFKSCASSSSKCQLWNRSDSFKNFQCRKIVEVVDILWSFCASVDRTIYVLL